MRLPLRSGSMILIIISIHLWRLSSQAQLRPWRTKAIPIRRHSCSMWELLLLVVESVTVCVLTQGVWGEWLRLSCSCNDGWDSALHHGGFVSFLVEPSQSFSCPFVFAGALKVPLEVEEESWKRLQKEQVGRMKDWSSSHVVCPEPFPCCTLADSRSEEAHSTPAKEETQDEATIKVMKDAKHEVWMKWIKQLN